MNTAPFHPRAVGPATAAALTASPHGADRVAVEVSADDLDAYRASQEGITSATAPGPWVAVTDIRTGHRVSIRAASCGLRCVCDMEVSATEREGAR